MHMETRGGKKMQKREKETDCLQARIGQSGRRVKSSKNVRERGGKGRKVMGKAGERAGKNTRGGSERESIDEATSR